MDYQWARDYRYDTQGNQTEMFSFQQGVLEAHWIFTYDARNHLASSQTVVADPAKDIPFYGFCSDCGFSSGRTVYQYDDHGRIREERLFQPGGELLGLRSFRYDNHGNVTQRLELVGKEATAKITHAAAPVSTFSYDSRANWIKQVTTSRQTITSVTYRTIKYY